MKDVLSVCAVVALFLCLIGYLIFTYYVFSSDFPLLIKIALLR